MVRGPLIVSICYDYFMGYKMFKSKNMMRDEIQDIKKMIKDKNISFIFCARSPEWTDSDYLDVGDKLIQQEFSEFKLTNSVPYIKKGV